jgi:hypothetical protein
MEWTIRHRLFSAIAGTFVAILLFVLGLLLPFIGYLSAPGFYLWLAFGDHEFGFGYLAFGLLFNSVLYSLIIFFWSKNDFAPGKNDPDKS